MNETPSIAEESLSSDSRSSSLFGFSLSSRQKVVLVGVVIVAAILLWRMRKSSEVNGAEEFETARTEDLAGDVEIEDDKEVIHIPVEPEDELEKDAAVIEALKDRGKIGSE